MVGFYSNNDRNEITKFYRKVFETSILGFLPLPAIRINRPPEEANRYVRDQQESTFLEEYVYPMRESIFVNGYEPFIENKMFNRKADKLGNSVIFKENLYVSKATIRIYTSNIFARIFIYLGICLSLYLLVKIFISSRREE